MTQKLALAVSLCLSAAMIIFTIIRASGLIVKSGKSVAVVWGVYRLYVEASVAVIMASLTAFRSFFVVRSTHVQQPQKETSESTRLALLRRTFNLLTLRKASGEQQGFEFLNEELHDLRKEPLPKIPRPVMTGMHTFIQGRGASNPLSMHSHSEPLNGMIPTIYEPRTMTLIAK